MRQIQLGLHRVVALMTLASASHLMAGDLLTLRLFSVRAESADDCGVRTVTIASGPLGALLSIGLSSFDTPDGEFPVIGRPIKRIRISKWLMALAKFELRSSIGKPSTLFEDMHPMILEVMATDGDEKLSVALDRGHGRTLPPGIASLLGHLDYEALERAQFDACEEMLKSESALRTH